MASEVITIGEAGVRLGVQGWKIRKLIKRGLLEETQRVGPFRVFLAEELPRIREALVRAGYLVEMATK